LRKQLERLTPYPRYLSLFPQPGRTENLPTPRPTFRRNMDELKKRLYGEIGQLVVVVLQMGVEAGKIYIAYHFIFKYW
jgi:hypothetical protein